MRLRLIFLGTCAIAALGAARAQDAALASADAAFQQKRYADAILLYRNVVHSAQPDKTRAKAQFQIGWCRYFLNDRPQAQTEWAAAADLFPDQAALACEALLRAGNSAVGGQDLKAAAGYYQRSADTYTPLQEARPHAMQARCWLGNVRLRMAENTKKEVSEAQRGKPDRLTGEQVWEQAAADFHAAEEAYARVLSDFPEAGTLRAEAEMLLISLTLESALYHQGKTYAEVVKGADAFLAAWPDDAVRRPTVLMMRAEALFYQDRFAEALADIETIQTRYAETAKESLGTSQFYKARCYESLKDYARAVEEYRAYTAVESTSFNHRWLFGQALFFMGRCLEGLGKPDEALAAYKNVLDECPDCPVAEDVQTYQDRLTAPPAEDPTP